MHTLDKQVCRRNQDEEYLSCKKFASACNRVRVLYRTPIPIILVTLERGAPETQPITRACGCQAVNEVASELAEFCESVADQMYMAEFMT
jgi:hypothetical protein